MTAPHRSEIGGTSLSLLQAKCPIGHLYTDLLGRATLAECMYAGREPDASRKGQCDTARKGQAHSLKILASLVGTVSMVLSTWLRLRSAAHCTLAGASPFSVIDCITTLRCQQLILLADHGCG